MNFLLSVSLFIVRKKQFLIRVCANHSSVSPICEVGQKLYYTVVRNVVNRIKCSVEANPIDSLEFKWFVNTSIEMFELKSFDSNSTTSIANYMPKTIMNYAIILCFAENSIGIQREPCIYKLKIESGN